MTKHLVTINIVSRSGRAPIGKLSSVDVERLKGAVRNALASTTLINWAVFELDIGLNDETQKGKGISWHAHMHGIGEANDLPEKVSQQLRTKFSGSRHVYRKVQSRLHWHLPHRLDICFLQGGLTDCWLVR